MKMKPDWALIEADFRAGLKSLRYMASEQGITEGAIRKRAKKDDWTRDLGPRIQAEAEARVRKNAVRSEVRTQARIPESSIVDANANLVYDVQMTHRADTARARALVQGLMGDLETLGGLGGLGGISDVDLADALRDQFQLVENQSDTNKRRATRSRQMLDAVLSVPSRIDSGKKIVETLEKLVRLEREIYGIAAASSEEKAQTPALTDADRISRMLSLIGMAKTRQQAEEAAAAAR